MQCIADYGDAMRRRGLAPGTIKRRTSSLRSFARWLDVGVDFAHQSADCTLWEATSRHVDRFLDGRKLSPRTRYHWLSHLHCFYVWAIDESLTDVDPTARIIRPKMARLLPRPISDGDLTMALESAPRVMYAWLCLAALAGMRCAEIAALDVDDVMLNDDLLRVKGKGGKERIVPMHPQVRAALEPLLPRRGAVFRRPRGGRFPAAMVSREGSLFLAGLGIEATMHQLRHYFGSQALRACRDLRVVQELLGHASPTTTAIYTAFSRAAAKEAVLALRRNAGPQESLFSER